MEAKMDADQEERKAARKADREDLKELREKIKFRQAELRSIVNA
jgi:hypothetical protein